MTDRLRRPASLLTGCAVSLGIALATPATTLAGGHQVECSGTLTDETLNGGVIVGPGDACVLDHVTVWGGLTVSGGTIEATDTAVHGGFVVDGGTASGPLCGDSVDGGLYVTDVTDPSASFVFGDLASGCAGPTVTGGVDFSANPSVGLLELAGAQVSGQLKDSSNGDAASVLAGDTVTGSARCLDDRTAPVGAGTPSAGTANSYASNTGCPAV